MERVLITGGTGFIGSNFVHKFVTLNYEVHLIVRDISRLGRIESVKDKVFLHEINMLNERDVFECVKKINPNIILHFAAYGAHQGYQDEIVTTIETNLLATINLLNACKNINFKCFINAGSSSEYGEKKHPISEEDLPEPNNLYGITKVASTFYCQHLAKTRGLPIITMRLFSPYGYFEGGDRLMPNIIRAALNDDVFNAPSPFIVRDFIFIDDVLDAYLKAITNADTIKGHILNVASGVQYSIGDVVTTIERILDKRINVVYGEITPRQNEPKIWVANISKIKNLLKWTPTISLEQGLRKNIEWFKENAEFYE